MKNPVTPHNEKGRLSALYNYHILDTLPEVQFDRIAELASLTCEVPVSLISFFDADREWFKSGKGLLVTELASELSFSLPLITGPDFFEIPDTTKDTRFKDHPFVTGAPAIRFYAGYPVIDPEGFVMGALTVVDNIPRQLTIKQKRILELLAEEISALLIAERGIEEEKIRENAIIASENKFRSFFEHSQGLMCTHDMKANFLSVNRSGALLIGYSLEELLTMSLFDIVPEKHQPLIHAYLQEIEKKGTSSGLMTIRNKNGSMGVWFFNNALEEDLAGEKYVIGNSVDITERLRLENDLKQTKELLEQAGKVARVGGWEINTVTGTLVWSDVTCDIHEVPAKYVPNIDSAIAFYKEGENRSRIIQALKEAREEGKASDLELQIITAGGKELWVRVLVKAEMIKGECKRIFGTFQDINETKRIKLALEASEVKYRAFFEHSPVGIAINRHSDGKFIEGNQALFAMIGYTEEEYRKLSHWDVTPAKYDDQEIKHRNSLTEIGRYGAYEKEYIHKDGHPVPVLLNGVKFIGEDGIEKVYSVIQDISERKATERALYTEKARLSAFIENTPAAVAMFDRDIKYIAVSNRWLEEYHLQNEDIIGRVHYEVFPEITGGRKDIHQRALQGMIETCDEYLWRPPGSDRDQYIRWEVRPWYLFDGTIGGIMIFIQDITTICLQREELKAAKTQAEQASIAKSEFLASMSHEIRTPLNGVIGFTDLILKTRLDETQKQYLSIVNQSGNALLSIVNDILDFSKIEAGKLELEIEKNDLYEIVGHAADVISYQLKNKALEMLLNISTDLPRFVWTDPIRLKQVLINLLSNAVKFTSIGEIELKIGALDDMGNNEMNIRFEVRDTGIGIQPEKQDKIFEAFSQEDGSVTKKYGGTGLGLTISNKLLALMGSKLHLVSAPDRGSLFYFDLLLKTERGEPMQWENIDSIHKVLIVDDNENNRIILKQMLLLEDIASDMVKDGIEALQLLGRGNRYDVILMDYNMPIMDGLETIKKIKQSFYPSQAVLPIALLSSSADDELIIKNSNELGVAYRLIKPIKIDDLYRTLSRIVTKLDHAVENEKPAAVEVNTGAIKVLLAEDGDVNMLLAKTIVSRIAPNAIIFEAKDGIEAVTICETQLPDIIFMDIQMPLMNGYEATKQIREGLQNTTVPIIAITAGNVKGEKEKCMEAGMNDFISKPIIEETIAVIFNKWIFSEEQNISGHTSGSKEDAMVHFEFEKIKAYMDGDKTILKGFLSLIRNELEKSQADLGRHVANKDLRMIKEAGHKLKGTGLSAGLPVITAIAVQINKLKEFNEQEANELLTQVRTEMKILGPIFNEKQKELE